MQRVTPDIFVAFVPVEESLQNSFLLALLQCVGEGILGWGFTCLLVNQAGLALLDSQITSPENWSASCVITLTQGPGGVPDG